MKAVRRPIYLSAAYGRVTKYFWNDTVNNVDTLIYNLYYKPGVKDYRATRGIYTLHSHDRPIRGLTCNTVLLFVRHKFILLCLRTRRIRWP